MTPEDIIAPPVLSGDDLRDAMRHFADEAEDQDHADAQREIAASLKGWLDYSITGDLWEGYAVSTFTPVKYTYADRVPTGEYAYSVHITTHGVFVTSQTV